MKKSQRNKKKTPEQKALVRQRRSISRIQKQIELKSRRDARLLAFQHANLTKKDTEIDEKINTILTQKFIFQKSSNSLLMAILLGYNGLFGKIKTTSFAELMGKIPTLAAINFVVAHLDDVMYGQNDPQKLRKQLLEFASFLNYKEKRALCNQLSRFQAILLFSNAGCFRFIYHAMQNYHPMPVGDYVLTRDDIRQIYKGITYCNQLTTDEQCKDLKVTRQNVVEALMSVDVPIVEFKTYKYFQTQLVKALRFFEFCENPMEGDSVEAVSVREEYRHYLQQFYQDMSVPDWKQYLKSLMLMILNQVKRENGRFITIKDGDVDPFIQTMLVDPKMFPMMDYSKAMSYLRGHFLWQMNDGWDSEGEVPDNTYLLLNSNLLVDRLYQGLVFSFHQSVNACRKSQNQDAIDFRTFKSRLGEMFAEPRLYYPIMQRAFNNERYRHLTGNELKEKYKMDGTSDYYLIIKDKLLLFEFKDNILGDRFKFSHDMYQIRDEILHRLCNPGSSNEDDNRKGVYQLMDTVQDLDSSTKYDVEKIKIENITTIYLIVVVTDTAFCANGVNAIITKEYKKNVLPQYTFKHDFVVHTPIIVNIDTLMNIAKRISDGFWRFEDMLDGYLRSISVNEIASTSTFDGYVVDEYIHKVKFDKNSATYIFGDDLKPLLDY